MTVFANLNSEVAYNTFEMQVKDIKEKIFSTPNKPTMDGSQK